MRLCFALSKPALSHMATMVLANKNSDGGRAGLFRVSLVQRHAEQVRLVVNSSADWETVEYYGFALCSSACGAFDSPGDFPPNNHSARYVPLGEGWYWWSEYTIKP